MGKRKNWYTITITEEVDIDIDITDYIDDIDDDLIRDEYENRGLKSEDDSILSVNEIIDMLCEKVDVIKAMKLKEVINNIINE
ncbi:MAG: hypothetical protein ABFS35_23555 [Bacteroidota bacterium]